MNGAWKAYAWPDRADAWMGVGAVATLALGTTAALAGVAVQQAGWAATGGVAAGIALVLLIAAGWLDGLVLVALTLPLPAFYSSESARIAPVVVVTAAAVMGWALGLAVARARVDLAVLPRKPLAVLLAAVLLSAAFAAQMAAAIREVMNMVLLLALLAAATDDLSKQPRRLRTLLWTLTLVVGLSGVAATVQAAGGFPSDFPLRGSPFQRATLGFGWPNELGMFMALGIPLCVCAYEVAKDRGARVLALACLGAAVLGLVSSFSRGSWLAVVAASLVLLWVGQHRVAFRVWLLALVAAFAVEIISGGVISGRVTGDVGGWFLDQRAALMIAGLLMFRAHPLVGVGPGGFPAALDDIGPQIPWLWDYIGSAHNVYLHMAAEVGVIGLAALLWFFVGAVLVLLRGARRTRANPEALPERLRLHWALLWCFVTAAALGMVEWIFAHGVGEFIMLVAAMGFAVQRRSDGVLPRGARSINTARIPLTKPVIPAQAGIQKNLDSGPAPDCDPGSSPE